ncbi:MAG: hypothetical protein PWP04_1618 [Candidatus Atribacteria bacterium]|nr:hypothetical protein [Candidatus Atribacteria bacterium]
MLEEDSFLRDKIGDIITDEGYYVIRIAEKRMALNCLDREEVEIMLVNQKILEEDSFELLRFIRERRPDMVVIATGKDDDPQCIKELLSRGVYDYLSRPFIPSRVLSAMKRAEDRITLLEENKDLKRKMIERFSFAGITGVSSKMQQIFNLILQVAQIKRPILLVGEQGTGKETIARAIHQYAFPEEKPFLKVLCGSLPGRTFSKGDFFKRSFSREVEDLLGEAREGTLYIEDIHLLPYHFQSEIMEFFDNYRFGKESNSLRVIASCEDYLEEEVRKGTFRNDLFYFLNAVRIQIPPLRERKEDIPFLVERFLRSIQEETGKPELRIDKEAMRVIMDYDWPGNITELQNTLEGVALMLEGETITAEDLPDAIRKREGQELLVDIRVGMSLEEVEKILIRETLKANRFNKSKTARMLGIGLRTLYRKIEQYHLAEEIYQ